MGSTRAPIHASIWDAASALRLPCILACDLTWGIRHCLIHPGDLGNVQLARLGSRASICWDILEHRRVCSPAFCLTYGAHCGQGREKGRTCSPALLRSDTCGTCPWWPRRLLRSGCAPYYVKLQFLGLCPHRPKRLHFTSSF